MDKEIQDYIDKKVKEEVKNYFEHQEEARKEIQARSNKYKGEIRKLILANADDVKKAYGELYKDYSEDTGDNVYASAKEKGLSIIDYICQYGDIKNLYGMALDRWGEKKNKLPTEEELAEKLENDEPDSEIAIF